MSTISGRRKEATAVVKLSKGKGVVTVNKKSIDDYFGRDVAKMIIRQPLVLAKLEESYDVDVKVNGGGSFGQAGAIRLAISKALVALDAKRIFPARSNVSVRNIFAIRNYIRPKTSYGKFFFEGIFL